jgi:hypothetical protein
MAATAKWPGEDEVAKFVDAIEDQVQREDSRALIEIMTEVTGEDPKLWGSVIGFGTYQYRYESGREGASAKVGFAPRKTNLTIYLLSGLVGYDDLLSRLGKHRTGKSCIYVKRLADLDIRALTELIARALKHIDQVERELGGLPRMSEMPPYRAD